MKTRQKVYISPAAVAKAAKKVPRRSAKKSVVPEEAAAATERELVSVVVVPHEDVAGSGIVTEPSEEEIAAQEFLASLHEKLEGCVSSPQVDVHCFAKRLVTESRSALRILAKREIQCSEQKQKEVEQPTGTREQRLATVAVKSKGLEGAALCSEIQNAQTFEDESSAEEKLAKQLATMLLMKPKRLARQFKDCRSPSSPVLATTNSTAFQCSNPVRTVQEKVRSYPFFTFALIPDLTISSRRVCPAGARHSLAFILIASLSLSLSLSLSHTHTHTHTVSISRSADLVL